MADEARYNHIDCLCDELLTEILIRLPNYKSVIQSTCVCKRWNFVASHPCIIPKFMALKLVDFNNQHNFAFAIQFQPYRSPCLCRHCNYFYSPAIFDPQKSSLSPLRAYHWDDISNSSYRAFASCKDLLLYSRHDNVKYDYSIFNVQTKQCVALPSLPYNSQNHNLIGFIWDTSFSNFSCHYSVVVIPFTSTPLTKLSAHVFSSHCARQWCDRVLSLKKPWRLHPLGFCLCFHRKLHFSCYEGLFGFDHNDIEFGNEIQCHLVEWPVGMLHMPIGYHQVGISQENLYLTHYSHINSTLLVWVLKDYKEGNWLLKHRVKTWEWVSSDSWMAKSIKEYSCPHVLGFDRSCSDVIYVVVPGFIFSCNLATKIVKWVCDTPTPKRDKFYSNSFNAYPVVYQMVPTPLSVLDHSLKDGVDATLASCSGL